MIMLYASTGSYRNIARHLLEKVAPISWASTSSCRRDSHLFMPTRRRAVPRGCGDYERFSRPVDEAYFCRRDHRDLVVVW